MPPPAWFDRQALYELLGRQGLSEFAERIESISLARLDQPTNGDLKRWVQALDELPPAEQGRLVVEGDQVAVRGEASQSPHQIRERLMRFHPWRKGPLWFFDHKIDTEWRSDWKWNRVCDAVSLQGCRVLDVGCGNGYFGWRMIEAGAEWVLGFDPILRFLMQFEVFNRYAAGPARHFVVPLADSDLPARLNAFDVVFSMGVLYHRTSPIDHLRSLADALVPGGTLILETLIIEGEGHRVLVPEDRYAQMRNVWFLPTVEMLRLWLRRTGFEAVELVDVSATTTAEQRSTDWMTFQSLADFLSPDDASKTIEGYSAPIRATLKAIRPR